METVDSYDFGEIVVGGRRYTRDLILAPGRVVENWWRREGHELSLEDLEPVLGESFDYLVVGTGYYGRMAVKREVFEHMERRGVRVAAKPTQEAVREYNRLVGEGRRVVGAFHLSC